MWKRMRIRQPNRMSGICATLTVNNKCGARHLSLTFVVGRTEVKQLCYSAGISRMEHVARYHEVLVYEVGLILAVGQPLTFAAARKTYSGFLFPKNDSVSSRRVRSA